MVVSLYNIKIIGDIDKSNLRRVVRKGVNEGERVEC